MAIDCIQALTDEYATALQDYCLNPDRNGSTAQHLGERAVAAGITMTELIALYQQALDIQLQPLLPGQDGVRLAKRSSHFLAQSLLPFEQQWQQTENALRRSEEQFRTVFEHAAIGIVITDRNHRIAHANPFFQNTLQYSAAELAEFGFIQITHPDDIALQTRLNHECLAGTRDTYRLEKRYIRKDGAVIWSDMTGTVVRDAIGHIQYSIVTMADTTAQRVARQEREQAEAALQLLNAELESRVWERTAALEQKNAELEALFRIFPDSFFKMAADGTYLDCRGQSPQDFYLPPEELIGRKVQDVLPAPMGQEFQATFQDVLQRDAIVNMEYALTINGTEKHYEARFVPIQPDQVVAIVRNISDRKRLEAERQLAQQTLRQNEERFRRIAANLPGMVYQYMTRADGSAVYTYVSPGCQQICEVEPAAVLADPTLLWRMTHPDDVSSLQQAVAVSIATMQPLHHEHRFITPTGQVKWVQLHSHRERLVNGDVIADGVAIDITTQKLAEAALLESEARFHHLAANIPGVFYQSMLGLDGTRQFTYISSGYARVFEADPAVLLAEADSFWQMAHPDDSAPLREEVMRSLATQQPFQFEYRIITPSGRIKWMHNVANRQYLPNGDIISDGVVLDITDRKTAEMALQASEQNFRTIFNHVSSDIWVHDVDGTVLDVNDRVLEHLGLTRTEALQVSLLDHHASAERPFASDRWQHALAGETVQFEWQASDFHTGAVIDLDIALNRIIWNGRTVVLADVRDITDRKRTEAAREQAERALQLREADLRRDRALFAGVFENSADALFLVSPETNCITNCNQRAVALFEVESQDALIGANGASFHKEPFQPEDLAAAVAAMATSGGWSQEIQYVTRKGNSFWGDCTAKRIQVDGEPLHLVRVTDITDRKAAAVALQTSEHNLRTIFNNVHHKIWVHDVDGNLLAVNDRVLEELIQNRSPLMQHSVLDHSDPSVHAILKHHWQRAFAGEIVHFEIQAPHLSNGTLVDLDIRLNRIVWDGRVVLLANVQNVTDHKDAERLLQYQAETAQLLATIVQTLNQSIQLEPVLTICLEQTRQFLQCDRVLICRFGDADAMSIELEAVSQPTFSLLGRTFDDPCFGQAWAERYRQGHIAAHHNIPTDAQTGAIEPCYATFLTQIQVQASLTVAILQADQLWGLLIVHQCTAPHQWQPSEVDLLQQLGLQIGIASQKASLYTQLEAELAERRRAESTIAQQMQRERLLRIISQQIRQSLRLDQILATTVTEIQRLLAADRAVIFRFNRDRSGVIIQEASLGGYPTLIDMYLTDRHFPQSAYDFYLTGRARAVHRTSDDPPAACLSDFMARIGVKSKLVAPILQTLEDDTPIVWGLLIVHACADHRRWQPAEVALLQQLATQVGIAIQQADLYSQIKDELTQKEVLLKEVHHRVKNNLQVVSALLSLQADAIQDPTVIAALQDSDNRLQAMALIHETLYQANDLGRLNFGNYIQRLADNILLANSRHLNAIRLTYALEPVFLTLDTAIPCGLLLNELVTNAIKHAFPNGRQGTICLRLQRDPTQPEPLPNPSSLTTITPGAMPPQDAPRYILSISDDGVGIPVNLNLEKLKSLGLRIASDLAQQLRGSLVLERHHGTQFHLTFADLSYRKRL